jgi:hypothetical protein
MESKLLQIAVLALAVLGGGIADADDAPVTGTLNAEQAQARQFGIFLGGTASQYDLCVRKGFLSPGNQSAEEIAKSIIEKIRSSDRGADQSAYVQDGWDMMKKEISQNESFYTKEKCSWVGKEWAKILTTMHKK